MYLPRIALLVAFCSLGSTSRAQCPPGTGNFLRFDGVSGVAAEEYSWASPVTHTIEAWVRIREHNDLQSIAGHLGSTSGTPSRGYGLRSRLGAVRYVLNRYGPGNDSYILSEFPEVNGFVWHHYAGTNDGVWFRLYRDGNLVLEQQNCEPPPTPCWGSGDLLHYFQVGASLLETSPKVFQGFLEGDVDEVRLWDHARTKDELGANMNVSLAGNEPGLLGYWPFDEGAGSTTSDATGGGHPLLLQGGVEWARDDVGTPYCTSVPNSSGSTARIGHSGTTSLAANAFTLTVSGCVPGVLGLFLYGGGQDQTPFGDGFLCVSDGGVGVFRVIPPELVGPGGNAAHHLDFTTEPACCGESQLQAGHTRYFQFWYRDPRCGRSGLQPLRWVGRLILSLATTRQWSAAGASVIP